MGSRAPLAILTFDIEDWFHILDVEAGDDRSRWDGYESRLERGVDKILSLLIERNLKATFFCLGWIAQKHPGVIRAIRSAGMEVASHTYAHPLLYKISQQQFREELVRSIDVLRSCTGEPVRAFRAPGFSLTRANTWVFEELVAAGISIDCSIFPTARSHGGFEGFGSARPALVKCGGCSIKEFPINVATLGSSSFVFSGGGYFRILPYAFIRYLMRRSDYVMTYFHPRDFDPDQPLLDGLSVVRRFKSYNGLKTSFAKLKRLLDDFAFCDLAAADAAVNWEQARRIDLSAQ